MAEMMRLQIVTPDEAFFDGEVSMVELNTADGEAGIYPKHIPMVDVNKKNKNVLCQSFINSYFHPSPMALLCHF